MSHLFYYHLMDQTKKKFFFLTHQLFLSTHLMYRTLSFPIHPLTLYSLQSSTTHDQHANPHLCDGHCAGLMTPPQGSQPSTQMVAHSAYYNHYASTHHQPNDHRRTRRQHSQPRRTYRTLRRKPATWTRRKQLAIWTRRKTRMNGAEQPTNSIETA
jgi:hypothetical protein